jgi:hypothetical protein
MTGIISINAKPITDAYCEKSTKSVPVKNVTKQPCPWLINES